MTMWWLSNLKSYVSQSLAGKTPAAGSLLSSKAIDLSLDELIAVRDRRSSFRQSQRIDGFRFGDLTSRRRGNGLELDSIGPYQSGDDIRHIDWFATARTGRPQVRRFRLDVQRTIILALDLRTSMFFGSKRQLMAKTGCLAAAKIAWSTSKDHQPLGLLLVTDKGVDFAPPRRGRRARLQHLARIVDAYREVLANGANLPSPSLADRLKLLPSAMSGDVEAVLISDFSRQGEELPHRFREIGNRGDLSAVLIEDELMRAPPPPGVYPLRDHGEPRMVTVAIRRDDANLYIKEADHFRRRLAARLLGFGLRQLLIADPESMDGGYFR